MNKTNEMDTMNNVSFRTASSRYDVQFVTAVEPAKVVLNLIARRFEQATSAYVALPDERSGVWRRDVSPPASSVYFVEGQLVALGRLRRLITSMGAISHPVARILLQNEVAYWEHVIVEQLDADPIVRSRLAYARGARDAAEALLGAFVNTDPVYWRKPHALDEWV